LRESRALTGSKDPAVLFQFGDCVLDPGRRELRRGAELIGVEPQVFDLLVYLIRNRDRVVTKDDLIASVWGGRIVSESTLTSRINAARKAVGDSGAEQALIRTAARKGLRFVADVTESVADAGSKGETAKRADPPPDLRQDVKFCTAADGARIAYSIVGNGPPLVKAANWLNHLEYDWQSPVWRPFLQALAGNYTLFRYDERGNGLSDWEVADISFEAFVRDLETVVEASSLNRFPLLGISQGCAVSIVYALRHPERVTHLVLFGGYARGRKRRGSEVEVEQADAMLTLMRLGWGQANPAFHQYYTSLFIPGGSPEQIQWMNELQRRTTSPDNAVRIRQAMNDIFVEDMLPQVNVPTLVLHRREDATAPFEEGRRMAAGIRGSRFVALEGRNHVILEGDPDWDRILDEISAFLKT
jgi:pimeloyl-ACP methyl ester carboxylesterase/DNA-binding winged helix-turn-helix (wHTH) protein